MMTKVRPTAIMALMKVCWATFSRLDTVRKWGVRIHNTSTSTRSPIRVPNCRPYCQMNCLGRIGHPYGALQNHFLCGFSGGKLTGDPALIHYQYPVAHTENFG